MRTLRSVRGAVSGRVVVTAVILAAVGVAGVASWLQYEHIQRHGLLSREGQSPDGKPMIFRPGGAKVEAPEPPDKRAGNLMSMAAPAAGNAMSGGRAAVAVSIPPLAYFVERIAGPDAPVEVLVGPGQSPHTFEPSPRQISALGKCQVLFRIGIGFEEVLIPKLAQAFPGLRVVDLRSGIKMRSLGAAEACTHDHGDEGHADHEHEAAGAPDPHSWLDPQNARIQARAICEALCEFDRPRAEAYRKGLAEFEADLERVDRKIADMLAPFKGRAIFVFHPAFGYFAERYGLSQIAVEVDGKEPSAKQLSELIERAKRENVRVIFTQPQFSARAAQVVAQAIGGRVVAMDDLASDYLANLERMAAEVKAGFETER